jgi:hypothetical protein
MTMTNIKKRKRERKKRKDDHAYSLPPSSPMVVQRAERQKYRITKQRNPGLRYSSPLYFVF